MVLKDPSTPAQVRCQSCYDCSNWQRLKWYKGQGSSAQAVTGFVQGWMGQRDVHLHWPMIKLQQSQTHRLCCDNKNINTLHKIPVNKPANCYTVIPWEFDCLTLHNHGWLFGWYIWTQYWSLIEMFRWLHYGSWYTLSKHCYAREALHTTKHLEIKLQTKHSNSTIHGLIKEQSTNRIVTSISDVIACTHWQTLVC